MNMKSPLQALAFGALIALGGLATTLAPAVLVSAQAQAPASKQIVDNAKARGLVGERFDGYLGVVSRAPGAEGASIAAAVDEINILRKTRYIELATQSGEAPSDVATVTGLKLIERTPAGQMVDRGGGWQAR